MHSSFIFAEYKQFIKKEEKIMIHAQKSIHSPLAYKSNFSLFYRIIIKHAPRSPHLGLRSLEHTIEIICGKFNKISTSIRTFFKKFLFSIVKTLKILISILSFELSKHLLYRTHFHIQKKLCASSV